MYICIDDHNQKAPIEDKDMTTSGKETRWVVDPAHTEISFRVKHLMITNVKGIFLGYQVEVFTDGDDFTDARITFTMNPASIFTGDEKRDAHLRSADFFDVQHFPEAGFTGSSFVATGTDTWELTGDLMMRGVTRTVKLNVGFEGLINDPWGHHKAGFTVTGKINRREWGLNWNTAVEAGGVMVSEEVRIECEVQLTRK